MAQIPGVQKLTRHIGDNTSACRRIHERVSYCVKEILFCSNIRIIG